MPPFCLSDSTLKMSFKYRLSESGTAGLRVKGIKRFSPVEPRTFSAGDLIPDSAKVVLWEDSSITSTSYQRVECSFPDSVCRMITFWAFELFSTSSTSVGVCIDSVCAGVDTEKRPTLALGASYCRYPAVTVDGDGNVHLVFTRDYWQPEACHCDAQIFYTQKAYGSSEWSAPAHVDSSGVGQRNYDFPWIYRRATRSRLAADSAGNIHVAWTDVGGMNEDDIAGDDVYYNWRRATDTAGVWQGCVVLSDDGEGALPDWDKALAPDIVVDGSENVVVLFHGKRPASYRNTPPDTMQLWWQRKTPGGSWFAQCEQSQTPILCKTTRPTAAHRA